MARSMKIKKNKSKPWSWATLSLVAFALCLIGSFFIPDNYFSNLLGRNQSNKDRSLKKKKNVLSMDLNKTIERSAKAIKAKDFDRAAKLATRIVKEYPESWIGWLNLGIAKRFGEGVSGVEPAIVAFQNAAKLNPELAEIQIYLASALACTQHIKAARAVAFKALSMSPNSIEALTTAAKVTNFSTSQQDGQLDSGAKPLLDKIKSILTLHEQSTDEDHDVNRLSPSQEAMLRFSLYKAYDENEEYSKAAIQLMSANNVKQFLNQQLLAMQGMEIGSWGKESTSALLGELLVAFDSSSSFPSSSSSSSNIIASSTENKEGEVMSHEEMEAEERGEAEGSRVETTTPLGWRLGLGIDANDKDGDHYCRSLLPKKKDKKSKKEENDVEENEVEDEVEEVEVEEGFYAKPLAIIGMPRSGATLLQQMLSSHQNILEGDEYNYFSASIQLAIEEVMSETQKSKLSMTEQVTVLSQNDKALKSLHTKYLTLLQSDVYEALYEMHMLHTKEQSMMEQSEEKKDSSMISGLFHSFFSSSSTNTQKHGLGKKKQHENGEKEEESSKAGNKVNVQSDNEMPTLDSSYYVIDRQSANSWWTGALPPCSKVILLQRHHMDLAYSNFKTNFPLGGYEYTNNQTELGWRIALSERLLALWIKVIPKQNLLVVNYHDLVEDTESTMRQISSFLSLSYNVSTIEPNHYGGVVTSPSSVNLRQAIAIQKYASNSQKWEKYASSFEEFMYAYHDAKKWISYVMDGQGVRDGIDASREGWLMRGAYFDKELTSRQTQGIVVADDEAAAAAGVESSDDVSLNDTEHTGPSSTHNHEVTQEEEQALKSDEL